MSDLATDPPAVQAPAYATTVPEEPTIDRLLRPSTDLDAILTLFPSSLGGRPYTKWEAVEWLGDMHEDHRVQLRQQYGQWTLRQLLSEVSGHHANCDANHAKTQAVLRQYQHEYPPLYQVEQWRDTLTKVVEYAKKPGPISKATLQRILNDPTWTSGDE